MKERTLGPIGEELRNVINATWGTNDYGPEIREKAVTVATRWKYRHLTTVKAVKQLQRLCAKAMRLDAQENGEA